ncbi:MAG: hypothetical protein CM15mP74_07920 [Halieaceae bacterium]|nr:MAG: hypothetical protein CM15mP74_07920 [Halieaceae bacterium]
MPLRPGFCVIPELLDSATLARQREALAPWIEQGPKGRNVFEGTRTHRVYAMLAKDPYLPSWWRTPLRWHGQSIISGELPAVGLPGHLFGAGRVGSAVAHG